MNTPKISIILPCYNIAPYLDESISSVLNQSLKDIEIICINDGSTDNTFSILEKYMKKDSRIIILNQENIGVAKTRNKALDIATGEFISFLDPDDRFAANDVLEVLYKKAKKHNVNICGGELLYLEYGKVLTLDKHGIKRGHFFEEEALISYKNYQHCSGFYKYIYNKDFLISNEIYFPHLICFEDPPFLAEAMIKAESFYAVKKVVYHYRRKHKIINWNLIRVNDSLRGILICLEQSRRNKLNTLNKSMYNPMLIGLIRKKIKIDKESLSLLFKIFKLSKFKFLFIFLILELSLRQMISYENISTYNYISFKVFGKEIRIKK